MTAFSDDTLKTILDSLFLPADEKAIWQNPAEKLRPGLQEKLMGIYLHSARDSSFDPRAKQARELWLDCLSERSQFHDSWPRIVKDLQFLIKQNPNQSDHGLPEMPSHRLFAEAMDICGIYLPEISNWILRIQPQRHSTPLTAGHVLDSCSGCHETLTSDDLHKWLFKVRIALVSRQREDLILHKRWRRN